MLTTATQTAAPRRAPTVALTSVVKRDDAANQQASRHIAETLQLLNDTLAPQRRVVHAGDVIYQAGERFGNLRINLGCE